MTFEPRTFAQILDSMHQRSADVLTDFSVGSVGRTMFEAFSYEIAGLYEKLQLVYLSAFVDTAQDAQLDMVVAVLSIKRGQPDFAEGVVTFQRDAGNPSMEIPIDTLVTTEDTPDNPKKAYQTIEAKVLDENATSVDVRVQAVDRGEQYATPAETVVVMPQPVPTIKSVVNHDPIRFTGKRRETDEELRERAKNALISSSHATVNAIANALLSLPGVKDVKVQENFYAARGLVTLSRQTTGDKVNIPKGTRLTAQEERGDGASAVKKLYSTSEPASMRERDISVNVMVRAVLEGGVGELTATGDQVQWELPPGFDSFSAMNLAPLLRGQFGITAVFVDGVDFGDPNDPEQVQQQQRLQNEIDRVRAAGVFVMLRPSVRIDVDGVFQIDLSANLKLSAAERRAREERVEAEISRYIAERRMGQPLLFSQLIKTTLSLDGVDNLEDFRLTTTEQGKPTPLEFTADQKRIELEEFQRFVPRFISVASEPKNLPIHIQFKAAGLNQQKYTDILAIIARYFDQQNSSHERIEKSKLEAIVASEPGTLKLVPAHWSPRPLGANGEVEVTFVEQAKVGDVFAYTRYVDLTGAIQLVLPPTMRQAEKSMVRDTILKGIEAYLEGLKSEEDVVFADLEKIARGARGVLDIVPLDAGDFQVSVEGIDASTRISSDNKSINVGPFEKARIARPSVETPIGNSSEEAPIRYLCVTGDLEQVRITVTKLKLELSITVVESSSQPADAEEEAKASAQEQALKTAVQTAINSYLNQARRGQSVGFSDFQAAIGAALPDEYYRVTELELTAESLRDRRMQAASTNTPADLHIRSVERAVMQPIAVDDIDVTTTTTRITATGAQTSSSS